LSIEELIDAVGDAGCAICSAGDEIAPADAVLYALRDTTATVDSIPLICGSILSKKLAEGIGGLVLDIKCGSGAVFPEDNQSRELGRALVTSGVACGLPTVAVLTDMTSPLGSTVGNAIEVVEAIECLRGGGPADLRELSLQLVARMLVAGGMCKNPDAGLELAIRRLDSGHGLERFERMVVAQQGDPGVLADTTQLLGDPEVLVVRAERNGWVNGLDALAIGRVAAMLGAARSRRGGHVDAAAGVRIAAPVGAEVVTGDEVLQLQSSDPARLESAVAPALKAIEIGDKPGVPRELVLGTIDADSLDELAP